MKKYRVTADLLGKKIVEQVEAQDEDAAWFIADQRHDWQLNNGLVEELPTRSELLARIQELETAGRPFAHPDLCKRLASNTRGDDSIIFQRDRATITLRDCKRIVALLNNPPLEKE